MRKSQLNIKMLGSYLYELAHMEFTKLLTYQYVPSRLEFHTFLGHCGQEIFTGPSITGL